VISDEQVVAPDATLEELERAHILAALERHHGNRAAVAAELGISERTLYYRLANYARR
jgi:transcriptional regulator with PAS, ATPase and Fis domain